MDKLFVNACIHTIDQANSIHQAIGIKDNKIAFLGSNAEAQNVTAKETIDLQGRLLLPGFIDTHMHLLHYAYLHRFVNLNDCTSREEVIAAGKSFLDRNASHHNWIQGWGWNQNKFTGEKVFLTKHDLDQVSTTNPVVFSRVCTHAATVNSRALEEILAMEEAQELMPFIDAKQGVLTEAAAFLHTKLLPSFTVAEIGDLLLAGQRDLNKHGITGVHSVDFMALPGNDWESVLKAYRLLAEQGKLTVRTYEQCMFNRPEAVDEFLVKGYRTGQGNELFKIGPLKLMADGSLGARTALLHEPYADDPTTCGLQVFEKDVLTELIRKAAANGMQIAVHGIGDKAIELATDILNEVNGHQGNPLRHGIIHAQLTNPEILEKMRQGKLLAYIQPVFIDADMKITAARIGTGRMEKTYAWKTMLDLGIRASGGSDAPVEPFNIMENIYFAVTRKDRQGQPAAGWLPEENLTVDEAVRLFTMEGAYASFEENVKGSLEVGKYADLVVVDRNIYEICPDDICNAKIVYTVVDGNVVYHAPEK